MSRRTRFIDRLTQPAGTLPALVWAACILLILALTVIGFPKGALSTDILDLLPSSSADVRTGELAQAATRGIADRVIWAVREDASNPGAADEFVRSLWERELVTSLSGRMDEADRRIWLEAMRRDVLGLLDEKTVSGLLGDKAKGHLRWMLGQLYSPVAGVTGDEWRADPWLLLRSVMMSQGRGMPTLDDGWITAKDSEGRSWRLLTGRVPESALSGDGLKAWIAAEADIRRAVLSERPDAAIAGQGVLYYSHHAASQAERDMKRLGSLSCVLLAVFIFVAFRSFRPVLLCLLSVSAGALCGTAATLAVFGSLHYSHHAASQAERDMKRLGSLSCVLLAVFIFVAFRSFRPVLLCLLSVSAGALCGTAATLAVFGSLHAVTLVMCLSLIGISADYTTYYLMRRRWAGGIETPAGTLRHLRPSLLHALLTTVTAYALMLAAPFPGLRQLALFAVCGLAGAWLTVVAWFPFLVKSFPVRPLPARSLLSAYADAWTQGRLWTKAFLVLFACVSVFGVARLSVNDDLSALQTPPVRLAAEEKVISSLLGIGFSQTWFAATGKTPDEAVQTLELLRPKIHELEKEGFISRPVMVPLRSLDVQEKALAAMKAAEPSMTAKLAPPCGESGCTPYGTVKLASWLAGPLGDNYRSLVARTSEGVVILVPVTLSAGKDAAAAAAAAAAGIDGVYWLNRRADFGELFSAFRLGLTGLIAAGLAVLGLMLVKLFGARLGLVASLPVAGGLLAGLAAAGITGTPVNLFSLFALILVMGIGVDYTIFFHSEEGAGSVDEPRDHVLHAMAVALGSTLLSLGILVLSETPAVRSFGLVLSAGVLFAFLLAPATRLITRRNTYREERPR